MRQHNPDGVPVRLQELLADRVLLGETEMDAAELAELRDLERQFPAEAERAELELGVALAGAGPIFGDARQAKDLKASPIPEVMPERLRTLVLRDADLILSGAALAGATGVGVAAGGGAMAWGAWSWKALAVAGWVSAGAAVLSTGALAVAVWRSPDALEGPALDDRIVFDDRGSPAATLSYAVVKAPDAVQHELAGTGDVTATAIWSSSEQGGLLQTQGLVPNDPAVAQYQVWIVDADRPAGAQRVDGGLFDAAADQDIHTIAVRPKLPVGRAAGFVVTLEPAGGSTASLDNSRVVLRSDGAR